MMMLKQALVAVLFAVGSAGAMAGASDHPGCAVVLDTLKKTVQVEYLHVVDVCLPDGVVEIDRIVIGNSYEWRVELGQSKDIIYIKTGVKKGGTNLLIYLKGEPEARYELRLRARPMAKN